MFRDFGKASVPMNPVMRKAIEAGENWVEESTLVCPTCKSFAHREIVEPRRLACYECNEVTFNPDARFRDAVQAFAA